LDDHLIASIALIVSITPRSRLDPMGAFAGGRDDRRRGGRVEVPQTGSSPWWSYVR